MQITNSFSKSLTSAPSIVIPSAGQVQAFTGGGWILPAVYGAYYELISSTPKNYRITDIHFHVSEFDNIVTDGRVKIATGAIGSEIDIITKPYTVVTTDLDNGYSFVFNCEGFYIPAGTRLSCAARGYSGPGIGLFINLVCEEV